MKKIFIVIVIVLIIGTVVYYIQGDVANNRAEVIHNSNITDISNNSKEATNTNTNTSQSNSTSNLSNYNKTTKRYCDVDGCYKEGTNKVEGFFGEIEYYCYEHYQEMLGFLDIILEN